MFSSACFFAIIELNLKREISVKKSVILFMIILVVFTTPVFALLNTAKTSSQAYIEGDAETGKIITQNHSEKALPIASLTKLMTYLLVMEHLQTEGHSLEETVTVPEWAVDFEESTFLLLAGEEVSVDLLLKALMIASANDAAETLGYYVSGSKEAFVERMNERAKELQLHSAVFYNPSGLPEGENVNVMSARDLFNLYRYLLQKFPQMVEIEKTAYLDVPEREYRGRSGVYEVFQAIPQLDSGKTGFIDESGYCFAGSGINRFNVERENYRFIVVSLGSPEPKDLLATLKEIVTFVNVNFHRSRVLTLADMDILRYDPEPWEPSFYFRIRNQAYQLTPQ